MQYQELRSAAHFGKIIAHARHAKGLTQRELGKRFGCTQAWISSVEQNSQPKTSLSQVLRLMTYLNITIEAKMNNKKSKPTSVDLSEIVD